MIDGPYGEWHVDPCNFYDMHAAVHRGQAGTGPYVIEASSGGCNPDASCVASFLLNAHEYSYLSCFSDEPTIGSNPDLARPLGAPLADAKLDSGVWTRTFEQGAVARWHVKAGKGSMQWPGQPVPPVPPTPGPTPPQNVTAACGVLLKDHTIAYDDVGVHEDCPSAQSCCNFCIKTAGCVSWAWHASTDQACHAHGKGANPTTTQTGTYAAVLPTLF